MARITSNPRQWTYNSLVTPDDMNRLEEGVETLISPDVSTGSLSSNINTASTTFVPMGLWTNYTIDVSQTLVLSWGFLLTTNQTNNDVLVTAQYAPTDNPTVWTNIGTELIGNSTLYRARLANTGDYVNCSGTILVPQIQGGKTYRFEMFWRVTSTIMTATATAAGSYIAIYNNL